MSVDEPNGADQSDDGGSGLGGSVGIVSRIVASAAKTMGHEKLAALVKRWPELVGEQIGKPLRKLEEYVTNGKSVPPEVDQEIHEAIEANPEEALALMGPVMAEGFEGVGDAQAERIFILDSYTGVLNIAASQMAARKTSLVLRGFLHDPDCVSYWHFKGFGACRFKGEYSFGQHAIRPDVGLEIYALKTTPSDESLDLLNREIRRSSDRQLPPELWDISTVEGVSLLKEIRETELVVERINPDLVTEQEKGKGDFALSIPQRTKSYIIPIPDGPSALPAMLESLFPALDAQDRTLHTIKDLKTWAEEFRRRNS